jgi:hypothetical protein
VQGTAPPQPPYATADGGAPPAPQYAAPQFGRQPGGAPFGGPQGGQGYSSAPPPPPYGAQGGSYNGPPPPPYGSAGGPYHPYPPQGGNPYGPPGGYGRRTNALAIISIIASGAGVIFLYGIGQIVGIILGFVALGQIKRSGEKGRGLAIAGIWIGIGTLVIGIILIVLIAIFASLHYNSYGYYSS